MEFVDLSSKQQFDQSCAALWRRASGGQSFDGIVGIATGGQHVARAMGEVADVKLMIVRCQRPTTGYKNRIRFIIQKLPGGVTRWLRGLEIHVLSWLRRVRSGRKIAAAGSPRSVTWVEGSADTLKTASRILLVDDAIDSGETIRSVMQFLQRDNPALNIQTAVITTTMQDPLVVPDFTLFNQTLVRFPWSMDARHE